MSKNLATVKNIQHADFVNVIRVRDSSGKPGTAACIRRCEDLEWIARPAGTPPTQKPYKRIAN